MPYRRYLVQLAIPCDEDGKVTGAANSVINPLEAALSNAKKFAVKINEGLPNEENTVNASWHICNHDLGQSCTGWLDIE